MDERIERVNSKAVAAAQKIIIDLKIIDPSQIQIEEIAYLQNILTVEKEITGSEGRLVSKNGAGVLTVKKGLHAARRRFVIAHEIGHHQLHCNNSLSLCDSQDFVDYHRKRPQESEANIFASELLMPTFLWKASALTGEPSWDVVAEYSAYFSTSFTATCIKYINLRREPVTLICSSNGKIKWFFPNAAFTYYHRNIGESISSKSVAHRQSKVATGKFSKEIILPQAWFSDRKLAEDVYFYESCYFSQRYDQTLSLVWPMKQTF